MSEQARHALQLLLTIAVLMNALVHALDDVARVAAMSGLEPDGAPPRPDHGAGDTPDVPGTVGPPRGRG